jgi:hypothetical protein
LWSLFEPFFSILFVTYACVHCNNLCVEQEEYIKKETPLKQWHSREKTKTDAFTHRFYYLNRKVIENDANRRCRNILERRAEKTERERNKLNCHTIAWCPWLELFFFSSILIFSCRSRSDYNPYKEKNNNDIVMQVLIQNFYQIYIYT